MHFVSRVRNILFTKPTGIKRIELIAMFCDDNPDDINRAIADLLYHDQIVKIGNGDEATLMMKQFYTGDILKAIGLPEGNRGNLRPSGLGGRIAWILFNHKDGNEYLDINIKETMAKLADNTEMFNVSSAFGHLVDRGYVIRTWTEHAGPVLFKWNSEWSFPFKYLTDGDRAANPVVKERKKRAPGPEKESSFKVMAGQLIHIGGMPFVLKRNTFIIGFKSNFYMAVANDDNAQVKEVKCDCVSIKNS